MEISERQRWRLIRQGWLRLLSDDERRLLAARLALDLDGNRGERRPRTARIGRASTRARLRLAQAQAQPGLNSGLRARSRPFPY